MSVVVQCAFNCSDTTCFVIVLFFLLNVIMQLCQYTLSMSVYIIH